jgi:hypothetical protein
MTLLLNPQVEPEQMAQYLTQNQQQVVQNIQQRLSDLSGRNMVQGNNTPKIAGELSKAAADIVQSIIQQLSGQRESLRVPANRIAEVLASL